MTENYPVLVRRYLATLVDLIVPFSIAAVFGRTLSANFDLSDPASALILMLPFLIYEPLLTSTCATFGQLIFKFRVRKLNETNRINIGQAYVRLILKYLLGSISLLTIPARIDRRAIHDLATRSIVINATNQVRSQQ